MLTLPETFWVGFTGSVVFGLLGIVLLLFGFKLFDWILPKVDFQVAMQDPKACAIVVASFFFSLAYIIASVVQ
jgi:putative membrane protein